MQVRLRPRGSGRRDRRDRARPGGARGAAGDAREGRRHDSAHAAAGLGAGAAAWTRQHLLGLEDLSAEEIVAILDTAESFAEVSTRSRKKVPALQGRIVFNLFFENSTRTRTSFSLAAKRLSADTQDFSASGSSLSKGESFIDTAKNIEAMGADILVVRHPTPGTPHLLAQHVGCSIINAGDGARRAPHPGAARPDDDPPRQGADRRPDRRPARRHLALAGRPVEHLGADQAGGRGDPLRPADAGAPGAGSGSAARSPTSSTRSCPAATS